MIIGSIDVNLTRNKSLIEEFQLSGRNLLRIKNLTGEGTTIFDTSRYIRSGTVSVTTTEGEQGVINMVVPNLETYRKGTGFIVNFSYKILAGTYENMVFECDDSLVVTEIKVNDTVSDTFPNIGESTVQVKLQHTGQSDPIIGLLGMRLVLNKGTTLPTVEIAVNGLKIEQGNKATGFSPAPEDIYTSLEEQEQIISEIKESTSPEQIIQTVVYSNEINSLLDNKANVEDLSDYANNDTLIESVTTVKEYVDAQKALNDETINMLESKFNKTASDITAQFGLSGGINLIQNSVGFFGTDFWTVTGAMQTITNIELERLLVGSAFYSPPSTPLKATQIIPTTPERYTISFFMKKPTVGNANITISYADDTKLFEFTPLKPEDTTDEYLAFAYTFDMPSDSGWTQVGIEVDSSTECYITGLMLSLGETNFSWTPHRTENANTNIQMNLNGIKVVNESGGYTVMSPSEFSGYAEVLDEDTNTTSLERIFTLNGENTEVNRLEAKRSISMGHVTVNPVDNGITKGWAFVRRDN